MAGEMTIDDVAAIVALLVIAASGSAVVLLAGLLMWILWEDSKDE